MALVHLPLVLPVMLVMVVLLSLWLLLLLPLEALSVGGSVQWYTAMVETSFEEGGRQKDRCC